jgi:ComF family protein
VTVWSYQPPIDAVLAALKFSRRSFLAEGLADAAWHHHAEVLASNDLITAIPLTWNRRLTRGFNQSELLARRLAGRLDLPYTALLRRSGRGVQSRSNKLLRRVNVSKAFRVRKRKLADLDRSAILLVDDVVTTGATLEAAARSLLAAGASRVTALAIVRTPEERRS